MVVGRVRIGRDTSIWYGSVLRGDDAEIVLGERCNVQDACVLHADPGYPAVLGERVSLGHGAIVHGARIDDDVLVGMRAVVLNGAHVGRGSLIAAGAVVRPGSRIPPESLVAGVPAQVRRPVTEAERETISRTPDSYRRKAALHRDAVPLLVPRDGGDPGTR
jgi:carbonic anhydrase/acetyltransferase-like protein (isoleucine patch superfamily)